MYILKIIFIFYRHRGLLLRYICSIKLAITLAKYVYSDINVQHVQVDININVSV